MPNYTLELDGPLFRLQRGLLLRLQASLSQDEAFVTGPIDKLLIDGLVTMADEIADQAHDRHGLDTLWPLDSDDGAEVCDCERPGCFYSGVPGVIAHVKNGRLGKTEMVQRCDMCQRFATDEAALAELYRLGVTREQ